MDNKFLIMFRKIGLILLGNTVYAMAVTMFILPNGLITGGTTGLALILNHFTGFSIAIFIALFNITMFVLGYLLLGRTFALSTLISTFYYPFALGVFQTMGPLQHMTSDRLLAAIYAGIMIGFSIGIVIKSGASTGGMDIPPLILNKKFGLPVAAVMYGFDFTILLAQMIFANKEQVLYGILMVLIYTMVLDKVLLLGQAKTQVQIISEKYQEINQRINEQINRGSTLICAETGHLHYQSMVVLTVVANRELPRLNDLVLTIDPKAFMIISRVNEVKGRGFTLEKVNK
jgi:Uncharacterized conserved protein